MSKKIDLGGFEVDISQTIRELRQDLRDDWFPDPIRYQDCLNHESLDSYFRDNIEKNHGVYFPSTPDIFNVPKKNFLLRYSVETSIYDRALYLALISHLIPYFDPLLHANSLGHRFCGESERKGKYLFKPAIDQFKAFEGLVQHAAGANKTILVTDVFNYFENIQVSQLKSCLETRVQKITGTPTEKIRVRRAVDLLVQFLKSWTYNGENGLPQNRDASSFLANLLMDSVDQEMIGAGYEYFRYMDDIRIVCKDRFSARAALKKLTECLRKIGMNLNSAKTKIGTISDEHIFTCFMSTDYNLESLDSMFRSRSFEVAQKAIPFLRKYAEEKMSDTQSRGFRFAVNRIESMMRCDELDIPANFFSSITDQVISALEDHPVSSDMLVRYLSFAYLTNSQTNRITSLLCTPEKSVYSWQNYLLWCLMIIRKNRSDELMQHATRNMSRKDLKAPDFAGAALYIGKFGSQTDKDILLKSFRTIDSSWLQRQVMIALHEVNFNNGIKEHVAPFVSSANAGTYQRVRRKNSGMYVVAPDSTSFKDLYQGFSTYE